MLTGDTGDLPPPLTKLSTTGLIRHETPDALRRWIDASIAAGLVVVSKDQYRTLSLTDRGRDVMRGRVQDLQIRRPSQSPGLSTLRRYRADDPYSWRALRDGRSRASRRVRFEPDRVHTRKVDGFDD
jgi:superfamily II DNA helicase RecQ